MPATRCATAPAAPSQDRVVQNYACCVSSLLSELERCSCCGEVNQSLTLTDRSEPARGVAPRMRERRIAVRTGVPRQKPRASHRPIT